MTRRKVIKRMLIRMSIIWRELQNIRSEWHNQSIRSSAASWYHQKAYTLKQQLRNKLAACSLIVSNDPGEETTKYLPELCYLACCCRHRVTNAKQFLNMILKANIPFDCATFEDLCMCLFDTKATCIDAREEEV